MTLCRVVPLLATHMLVSTLQAGAHTLPRNARIHVGQAYGAAGEPEKRCEDQPLRAGNIRHMFARYHVLQPGEEHDHYLWFACGTRETVTVRGKVSTGTHTLEICCGRTTRTDDGASMAEPTVTT